VTIGTWPGRAGVGGLGQITPGSPFACPRLPRVSHSLASERESMDEQVISKGGVSAGTYRCTDCGIELKVAIGAERMPPCPECQGTSFETARGGDSAEPSTE